MRPTASRSSSDVRAEPYKRPASAPSTGQWQHDLFTGDSRNPQLNTSAIASRLGIAAPTTAATRHSGTSTQPASSASGSGAAGSDVLSRFGLGIKGAGDAAEKERERKSRVERERQERARRQEEDKARKEQEQANKRQREIARRESEGFVVQVDGLVYGTTAEDVQTAFGQYGETSYCFIVNDKVAAESDDLVARLVFERKKDADMACQKLDGAIADGKPLKVRVVPGTPFPNAVPSTSLAAVVRASNSSSSLASEPRAYFTPPPPTRKMYADDMEEVQPSTASATDSGMDVDMDEASSSSASRAGSSRGRGGRRGGKARGGGGAGAGAGANPAASKSAPSLLDRFGATPSGGKKGGAGGGSLLARLG